MVFVRPEMGCLRGHKFAIFVCLFGSAKLTFFALKRGPLFVSSAKTAFR